MQVLNLICSLLSLIPKNLHHTHITNVYKHLNYTIHSLYLISTILYIYASSITLSSHTHSICGLIPRGKSFPSKYFFPPLCIYYYIKISIHICRKYICQVRRYMSTYMYVHSYKSSFYILQIPGPSFACLSPQTHNIF